MTSELEERSTAGTNLVDIGCPGAWQATSRPYAWINAVTSCEPFDNCPARAQLHVL